MKKIAFICNWPQSPEQLLDRYLKQTPGNIGKWNDLIGVSNLKEADFFIIQDGIPHQLVNQVDLTRAIFIKREPPHINPHPVNVDMGKVLKAFNWPAYVNDFLPAAWWIERPYDELLSLRYPTKDKKASCIVTNKYRQRTRFITSYASKYPGCLDVFGKWNFGYENEFRNSNSYKGELNYNGNCKFDGLYPYEYTLAFENGSIKNYWTEKIVDAFLSWTVPIYWGCTNINDYFPAAALHTVDISSPAGITNVHELIQNAPSHEMIQAVEYSREKILKTYNLWAVIERLLENEHG